MCGEIRTLEVCSLIDSGKYFHGFYFVFCCCYCCWFWVVFICVCVFFSLAKVYSSILLYRSCCWCYCCCVIVDVSSAAVFLFTWRGSLCYSCYSRSCSQRSKYSFFFFLKIGGGMAVGVERFKYRSCFGFASRKRLVFGFISRLYRLQPAIFRIYDFETHRSR